MDRKHSSDGNDDNSLELNETEDSNQYHHVTRSHNFEYPKSEIQMMKDQMKEQRRRT